MNDMDHTWGSFITEVTSYLEYGFDVHEKVFRRRLRSNGSRYNDGLVGWKKLAQRNQNTITGWKFSEDGRELLSVEQSVANLSSSVKLALSKGIGSTVEIPKSKFLLFTCDSTNENPEGRSILKGAYTSYKKLQLLQDQMMIGVARDLGGVPVFGIPLVT